MAVTTACHSDEQIAQSLASLRPRGDAWRHGGFDALAGSGMGDFFAALGAAFGPTDRRVCDMVDEFFCSTAAETLDLWALDYGVPDGCDPFENVCEKVNAVGTPFRPMRRRRRCGAVGRSASPRSSSPLSKTTATAPDSTARSSMAPSRA